VQAAVGSRDRTVTAVQACALAVHSYVVELTANDGANNTAKTITVNLTDANDNAPVITTAATQSVPENTTLVAALTSTDADTVGKIGTASCRDGEARRALVGAAVGE